MSTSKSSSPFNSNFASILKPPANSSKLPRATALRGGILFSQERNRTCKVFLEEDRVPGALHYSASKGKHRPGPLPILPHWSGLGCAVPPPNQTEQWSSPLPQLLNGCSNFQVARQVQRGAGVCGGPMRRQLKTRSTNQRPCCGTVLNQAIILAYVKITRYMKDSNIVLPLGVFI